MSKREMLCVIYDVLLKVNTEILPSDDAQARMAPSSWGAQDTELTTFLPLVC